jgi:drug/metabolite transporter (DMT)-like permease
MHAAPNWLLFVLATLIWGTTWHAIVYQIALLPPEIGVALRFAIAALAVLGFCVWRGERLALGARTQAWLALQGVTMFGLSYIAVYHAERHVPSGLVAIGYSASPLINGVAATLLWGHALTRRFLAGGVLGVVGVALIFWPELAGLGAGAGAALGAVLTVAAVLLSSVGNLVAIHSHRRKVPFWPAFGCSLAWGALSSFVLALALGQRVEWPAVMSWWLSLGYLALVGTVFAFACFLTLQQRLGAGAASTVGVTTPLIALVVSAAFEGWRPGALAFAGIALALAGNVLMLFVRRAGVSRAAG